MECARDSSNLDWTCYIVTLSLTHILRHSLSSWNFIKKKKKRIHMWSGSLINFILLAITGVVCYDYSKAYLWRRPPTGVDWSFGPVIVDIEASLSYFEVWSVYKLNYTCLTRIFLSKNLYQHIFRKLLSNFFYQKNYTIL